jgi:transcriptional regulator GlxA family with amidase domain
MDTSPISESDAPPTRRQVPYCRVVPPANPAPVRLHQMSARATRRRVVEVVSEFLRNHAAEGVRIAEASRAVGVSERTLRNAFHREHGISPKQFDLRERLRAARHALCEGTSRTVTEIATEFGFFELGRFSRIYRDAFGELPSQTIKAAGLMMRRAS